MRYLERAVVTLLALIVGSALHAEPRLSEAGRTALDSYLGRAVERHGVPGLVAMVVSRDAVLYTAAVGQQDVANGVPMAVDSIFRIASMTKPITSVAVMMLVETGRIGLDDPIERYLPEFTNKPVFATFDAATRRYTERPATRPITVRHLLTHTSGLGYAWSSETLFRLVGAEDASTSAAHYPLLHDPGARWTYGESTRVLGRLVESVAGQPLEVFLRERVLDPLGMRDTAYVLPPEQLPRLVTAHVRDGSEFVETPNPTSGSVGGPARGDGGLFATASDYARFVAFMLREGRTPDGRELLRPATIADMGRNHIGNLRVELQTPANATRSRPFPLGAGQDGFGLGFQVASAARTSARAAGSLSWAGIQNTQFWIDPANEIAAVLLMQYLPFYDALAIEILQGFEQQVYAHLVRDDANR